MNIKNSITSTIASLAVLGTLLPSPALAGSSTKTGTYNFDRGVGSVYVSKVKVKGYLRPDRKYYTRTRVSATFTVPKCGSRYYLQGKVEAKYTSKSNNSTGWMLLDYFDSRRSNYEGSTLTRTAFSTAGLNPKKGTVTIRERLTCKSLAPLRTNIPKPDVSKYDPTKGIFW